MGCKASSTKRVHAPEKHGRAKKQAAGADRPPLANMQHNPAAKPSSKELQAPKKAESARGYIDHSDTARSQMLQAFVDEFRYLDQNQDGLITQDDVAECLVQFGIDALSVRAPDGQGPIRQQQYLEWRQRTVESEEFWKNMDNIFCFADSDFDGLITKDDLTSFTSLWTPRPSADNIDRMLQRVNWRGTRELDAADFRRMMKGEASGAAPQDHAVEMWVARWRCLNILYLPGYFV